MGHEKGHEKVRMGHERLTKASQSFRMGHEEGHEKVRMGHEKLMKASQSIRMNHEKGHEKVMTATKYAMTIDAPGYPHHTQGVLLQDLY